MPASSFLYALPRKFYEEDKIRKYGFHGTSYAYVLDKLSEYLKKPKDNINTVICHIGSGASICCIKNGKCDDTSMGLTPLEGLSMGTRCGDIDASVV